MAHGQGRSSLPPSSAPTRERLVGSRRSTLRGERPVKAQVVIALVLGSVLVAVPAYLLRRPGAVDAVTDANASDRNFGGVVRAPVDAGSPATGVLVGALQRVRCGQSVRAAAYEGAYCDALPPLESAFRHAIQSTIDCAPRTGKEGSINYVLEIDFQNGRLNVFPGRSGRWRGRQARRAASCVLEAMAPGSWTGLAHQYDYYAIAILATYPEPDPLDILPSFD